MRSEIKTKTEIRATEQKLQNNLTTDHDGCMAQMGNRANPG